MLGIHLNYIPGSYRPHLEPGTKLDEVEQRSLEASDRWYVDFGAYAHLQRNTPQTAAYGLNDSPAALAAWIVEKFRDWSDCYGDVEHRFTKDELLSNVTLYWMTETIQIQLKKGALELCVLALLARRESYAYEIASTLAAGVDMGEGTIYPLMRRMQSDGLVTTYLEESSSGPPRKYYQLTKAGRAALIAQKAEWNAFTASVAKILADVNLATPVAKIVGAGS